ncbi:MAG: isocitrate/isopropylmalate dehydrogenase family protein [Deltaproteobacteria bacterium]|nr:isocitrate/isopropylmalate dehydrogenase family protein [Deltaproteobacteria bacterium]
MAKNVYSVVLMPGDGIGVEVADEARRTVDLVAERVGASLEVEEIPCGGRFFLEHGSRDWPDGAEEQCASADLLLLGAVGWPSPRGGGPVTMPDGRMAGWSAVIGTRTKLDLYANVRPVKLYPGVLMKLGGAHREVMRPDDVDMVFVRENTEGLYSGMGGVLAPGGRAEVATDVRVITRRASERVIRMAFELSRRRARGAPEDGKRRVTCIVKDNVLRGCQLFAQVFREIGADYPDIAQETALVDSFTLALLAQPAHFDVLVTTNIFGDIVTDLAAALQGGMGMAVGCNVGDRHAMFEPIHGSAPTLPRDTANPMAMLLSTSAGLAWLGDRHQDERLRRAARAIEESVAAVLERGEPLTADLVGADHAAPLSVVADAVRDEIRERLVMQH